MLGPSSFDLLRTFCAGPEPADFGDGPASAPANLLSPAPAADNHSSAVFVVTSEFPVEDETGVLLTDDPAFNGWYGYGYSWSGTTAWVVGIICMIVAVLIIVAGSWIALAKRTKRRRKSYYGLQEEGGEINMVQHDGLMRPA